MEQYCIERQTRSQRENKWEGCALTGEMVNASTQVPARSGRWEGTAEIDGCVVEVFEVADRCSDVPLYIGALPGTVSTLLDVFLQAILPETGATVIVPEWERGFIYAIKI